MLVSPTIAQGLSNNPESSSKLTDLFVKVTLVWEVTALRPLCAYWDVREMCRLYDQGRYSHPDDGGSRFVWNVVKSLSSHRAYITWDKLSSLSPTHITFANHLQNFIQHPALKVNSICEGIYRGLSMWLSTQQVDYRSYILHSPSTWEKMGVQWRSSSALHRLQESLWFS